MQEGHSELDLKVLKFLDWKSFTKNFFFSSHHLNVGDVALPPQVFLVFGSHSSHHIISVHNYMNK